MLPKRWMTAVGAAVLTAALATGVAFAAGGEKAGPEVSAGVKQLMTEIRSLRQTRMQQLRAETDALIDKAAAEGKITTEEAARLKQGSKRFGQGHKPDFKRDSRKFLKGATEAEVKAKLDAAVKSGRLTQEQANQILQNWRAVKAKEEAKQ